MYLKIVPIVFFLALSYLGIAQQENDACGNHIHKISTNPMNPINEEWKSWYPNDIGSYINTGFSWYPGNQVYISKNQQWSSQFLQSQLTGNSIIMNWPFSQSNTEIGHLFHNPDPQIAFIPDENRDWHWEDGWELLYLNIGQLPNGTQLNQKSDPNKYWNTAVDLPTPNSAPYIALYNRYTGLMRVFFSVWGETEKWDEVTVSLEFENFAVTNGKISGIFRHANGLDQPLTEATKVTKLVSPRPQSIGDANQWYVAEFQLGYDACQCAFGTTMQLKFRKTNSLKADLHTRTIELEKSIVKLQDEDLHFFQSMLGGVDENGDPAYAVPGNVIYKNMEDLSASYKDAMNKYKSDLKDYNKLINHVKIGVVNLATKGIVNGLIGLTIPSDSIKNFLIANQLSIHDKLILPEDTSQAKKWAESIESTAKKTLAGQFDFLSTVFGIREKPTPPSMPVATFTEGRIVGNIVDQHDPESVALHVPGSNKSGQSISGLNFPAYNHTPGLFALLELPKLGYYDGKHNCSYEHLGEDKGFLISNQLKGYFRFKDPVKYALNPALDFDLEKTKILGSLVVEIEYRGDFLTYFRKVQVLDQIKSSFKINHSINENGKIITELVSEYRDLKQLHNQIFELNHIHSILDLMAGATISHQWPMNDYCYRMTPKISKIKFKVAADMYFKQIGSNDEQVKTFQVFTYEIFDKAKDGNLNSAIPNGKMEFEPNTSWVKYNPWKISLSGIIQPNNPYVWQTIGNKIFIKVESVNISDTIGPAEGYELIIEAINTNVTLDAKVLENTEIISKQFSDAPPSLPIFSANDLPEGYCYSNKYGANVAVEQEGEGREERKISMGKDDQINTIIQSLNVYPNPANNEVNVEIEQGDFESSTVRITNLNGQVVLNETVGQELANAFAIDVSDIPNGYYILTVITNTEQQFQHQLIIHK